MPTFPRGRWGGAEVHRIAVTREDDNVVELPGGKTLPKIEASIGGNDEIGYYLVFRGDPEKVTEMLDMMTQAAKQMLPAGRYNDKRSRPPDE